MLHSNHKNSLLKILCGLAAVAVFSAFAVNGTAIFAKEEIASLRANESVLTITGSIDLYGDGEPLYPYSLKQDNVFEGDAYYTQLDDISKDMYELLYSSYKNGGHKNRIDVLPVLKKHNKIFFDDETTLLTEVSSHAYSAFLALAADHPELSWISYTSYSLPLNIMNIEGMEIISANFMVTKGYSYGTAAEINDAIDNAKKEIVSEGSCYELVKSIHDYICTLVDYNHTAVSDSKPAGYDTGWYQTSYSAFYPISSNKETEIRTVCAGYATAFKVLCDAYGIPCVTVRGTASSGERHMWNYVRMEDGEWYAVDATWDDQTESVGKIYYNNFLAGGNTPTDYGLTFSERHINSGYWESQNRYLFAYPKLSKEEYDPDSTQEPKPDPNPDPDPDPDPNPDPDPDPDPDEGKTELTDETGNTGIVVIADKNVLDENAVLNVEEKAADPENPNRVTYDITLMLNGEKVQPNGSVTVKIPVPEAFEGKKCRVYYRDMTSGEEKLIDMGAVVEDGFFVFTAEHFSEYIVAYDENTSTAAGDLDGNGRVNDQDSILLDRYLAEWDNLIYDENADMNGDGKVNDQDSIILARTLAGWYF